jgi:hypothetical protein
MRRVILVALGVFWMGLAYAQSGPFKPGLRGSHRNAFQKPRGKGKAEPEGDRCSQSGYNETAYESKGRIESVARSEGSRRRRWRHGGGRARGVRRHSGHIRVGGGLMVDRSPLTGRNHIAGEWGTIRCPGRAKANGRESVATAARPAASRRSCPAWRSLANIMRAREPN